MVSTGSMDFIFLLTKVWDNVIRIKKENEIGLYLTPNTKPIPDKLKTKCKRQNLKYFREEYKKVSLYL